MRKNDARWWKTGNWDRDQRYRLIEKWVGHNDAVVMQRVMHSFGVDLPEDSWRKVSALAFFMRDSAS